MRLGLNVASTRVVLLNGHEGTAAAGRVIEAFGEFVIGGNYAVGFIVFSILIIINFVVITKGAGRVSEVIARFTLDALPGKQMAIDADLNAGLLIKKLRKSESYRRAGIRFFRINGRSIEICQGRCCSRDIDSPHQFSRWVSDRDVAVRSNI